MQVLWMLIVLVFQSSSGSPTSPMMLQVSGFKNEAACQAAGRQTVEMAEATNRFPGYNKRAVFTCVRDQ